MEQLEIGQHTYTIGRLNAIDQLHVSRKIAPIVPKLMPILTELAKGELAAVFDKLEADNSEADSTDAVDAEDLKGLEGLADALSPLMDVFAQMNEDDVNCLIHKCLGVVKRGTALVSRNNSLMFDDIDLQQIVPLMLAVIRINLGGFIQGLLTKASATAKQSG